MTLGFAEAEGQCAEDLRDTLLREAVWTLKPKTKTPGGVKKKEPRSKPHNARRRGVQEEESQNTQPCDWSAGSAQCALP